MKIRNKNNGITLIALVITIIVMLILVAVTISMAVNGGLFEYASNAGAETNAAIANEQELANLQANMTTEDLINKYTGNNGKVEVETIPTTKSYVGCYADFNGDGIPEGIIYADLAHTVSGRWNNVAGGDYAYTAESGLKNYYIKEENYTEGVFSNKDENDKIAMIAPINETTGKDRFYVMALENITVEVKNDDGTTVTSSFFSWYRQAEGKLNRPVEKDYNDFGEGKKNTIDMLNDWNNNTATYGAQTKTDLWGAIQESKNTKKYPLVTSVSDSKKWFVPSKAELVAFADCLYTKLGISEGNFEDYGFGGYYQSSSQRTSTTAYEVDIKNGYVFDESVAYTYDNNVRLSATF